MFKDSSGFFKHPIFEWSELDKYDNSDTIAAIATAVSNAGIGIIRISGEDSMRILEKIFEPYNKKKDVASLESHHVYYGNIRDGDTVVDECIVIIMKAPTVIREKMWWRSTVTEECPWSIGF